MTVPAHVLNHVPLQLLERVHENAERFGQVFVLSHDCPPQERVRRGGVEEAGYLVVFQQGHVGQLDGDFHFGFGRERDEVVVVVVVGGEAGGGLDPQHGGGEVEGVGHVGDPGDEGVVYQAGYGPVVFGVFLEHFGEELFPDEFELREVLV